MEKQHLEKIETHIATIRSANTDLGDPEGWDSFWKIIHQPGWTTIAEAILVVNTLESIAAQTAQLANLKKGLFNGARSVNVSGRAANA